MRNKKKRKDVAIVVISIHLKNKRWLCVNVCAAYYVAIVSSPHFYYSTHNPKLSYKIPKFRFSAKNKKKRKKICLCQRYAIHHHHTFLALISILMCDIVIIM